MGGYQARVLSHHIKLSTKLKVYTAGSKKSGVPEETLQRQHQGPPPADIDKVANMEVLDHCGFSNIE
ncbi:hypothetical protein BaRGS_00018709 [Batillaria attramentaria]|uniref:Uncharacterized protein n=1 Tax=Batillaria attramentaria TaxID=370345 RepID=A0ABD0KS25_9CAEN